MNSLTHGWAIRRSGLVVLVLVAISGHGWAAEEGSSVRTEIANRLKADFSYRPKPVQGEQAPELEGSVGLDPMIVSEGQDKSAVAVGRFLRQQRAQELARRPTLEGGASTYRAGATLGPRPYDDLLKEDARFRTKQAVTPTWTLLRFGRRE